MTKPTINTGECQRDYWTTYFESEVQRYMSNLKNMDPQSWQFSPRDQERMYRYEFKRDAFDTVITALRTMTGNDGHITFQHCADVMDGLIADLIRDMMEEDFTSLDVFRLGREAARAAARREVLRDLQCARKQVKI